MIEPGPSMMDIPDDGRLLYNMSKRISILFVVKNPLGSLLVENAFIFGIVFTLRRVIAQMDN